jgi:hypothetical protein
MYLAKIFRHSKLMGVAFSGFALLSVVVNIIKYQATPFFLWGMFSANAPIEREYEVVQFVTTDNDTLNYSSFATSNVLRTMLLGSADLAQKIAHNKAHPLETVLVPKLAKRLSAENSRKIGFFLEKVLHHENTTAQLKADSLWRVERIAQHFHTKIKRTFVQKVVF